eukprot:CAMPEP_0184710730 /NCGR_PEP_ID=MMETSP0314-20130426/1485_1 /TAXON_ID=38298 /ORGANISM="Rhodella maculata, Strain CCMP 736" /LENGTH=289 /DNA_ID=CAMNT_0027172633 /DNA_START=14 /DNA_END=883 /DNA_ORIENTATION=+
MGLFSAMKIGSKPIENVEYKGNKGKIEKLITALEAHAKAVEATERDWQKISKDQAAIAKDFVSIIPGEDDPVGKKAEEASEKAATADTDLAKTIADKTAPYTIMQRNVLQYLDELKAFEKTIYPAMRKKHNAYESLNSKYESLTKKKKKDEMKITAISAQREVAQKEFDLALKETLVSQNKSLEKHKSYLKAALCASISVNKDLRKCIVNNVMDVTLYAEKEQQSVLDIDWDNIEPAPKTPAPTTAGKAKIGGEHEKADGSWVSKAEDAEVDKSVSSAKTTNWVKESTD